MGIDAKMFYRTKQEITREQVLHWSWELCSLLGRSRFLVIRPDATLKCRPYHALSIMDGPWLQDGPSIVPEPGETFIEVNLFSRYYGKGYERGDLWLFIAIARFLEDRIPNGSVWYGGDSSEICAEPFDYFVREDLIKHWLSSEGYAYFNCLSEYLCDFCKEPMINSGGGPGKDFYSCRGCGLNISVESEGVKARLPNDEGNWDLFPRTATMVGKLVVSVSAKVKE